MLRRYDITPMSVCKQVFKGILMSSTLDARVL